MNSMNKTLSRLILLLAIALVGFVSARAGDLEPPPGTPAPTMNTLQEIFEAVGGGTVSLPATGQDSCWDADGNPINCLNEHQGQDGGQQNGQTISPRFTVGAGVVKDNLTGLVWTKRANCGATTWSAALLVAYNFEAGQCEVEDGSQVGDRHWRLPNIVELRSLLWWDADLAASPNLPPGHPFVGVNTTDLYWTSTTVVTDRGYASLVNFYNGGTANRTKPSSGRYWLVRDGELDLTP